MDRIQVDLATQPGVASSRTTGQAFPPSTTLDIELLVQWSQKRVYLAQDTKSAQFIIRHSHLRLRFVVLLSGGKGRKLGRWTGLDKFLEKMSEYSDREKG